MLQYGPGPGGGRKEQARAHTSGSVSPRTRELTKYPPPLPLNSADLLQGLPIGLTFGTLPFLLKAKLSYSQLALFSLSTYPYSLKLLWSPIVDACFSARIGRRKSWIIPVQALIGCAMWWLGGRIDGWLAEVSPSFGRAHARDRELTL